MAKKKTEKKGVEKAAEPEETESISEEWVPRWETPPLESRDDRLVQEAETKTLVIINDVGTRSRSLATTQPEQIPMRHLQISELQCSTLYTAHRQRQTLPADGARHGMPTRLEDIDCIVPPIV